MKHTPTSIIIYAAAFAGGLIAADFTAIHIECASAANSNAAAIAVNIVAANLAAIYIQNAIFNINSGETALPGRL